jgi:hypothetical protein
MIELDDALNPTILKEALTEFTDRMHDRSLYAIGHDANR